MENYVSTKGEQLANTKEHQTAQYFISLHSSGSTKRKAETRLENRNK